MFKSMSQVPAWLLGLAAFAVGAAAAVGGDAIGVDRDPILSSALMAGAFLLATPVVVLYWRKLDEAAREAHKFAWYWGGSAGLILVAIVFAGLMSAGADLSALKGFDAKRPEELLAMGMTSAVMAQITGYLIAWAGWWIARR